MTFIANIEEINNILIVYLPPIDSINLHNRKDNK